MCVSLSTVPMGWHATQKWYMLLGFLSCQADLEHFHCSSRSCGSWDFAKAFISFNFISIYFPRCLKSLCSQLKTWKISYYSQSSFLFLMPNIPKAILTVTLAKCLSGIWVFVLQGRSTYPWEVSISWLEPKIQKERRISPVAPWQEGFLDLFWTWEALTIYSKETPVEGYKGD